MAIAHASIQAPGAGQPCGSPPKSCQPTTPALASHTATACLRVRCRNELLFETILSLDPDALDRLDCFVRWVQQRAPNIR